MITFFLYLLTGAFAGTLSGLFGIGGGMVVVPILSIIFKQAGYPDSIIMHVASASSLCIMIFTTQMSARVRYRQEGLDFSIYRKLVGGCSIGVIAGVCLADQLPTDVLRMGFGIFLLFVATRSLIIFRVNPSRKMPGPVGSNLMGIAVGMSSGLLGVGGGVVMMPFLTYCNIDMRRAIGVSTLLSLTLAATGAFTSILTGHQEPNLPGWHTGYINWPAVIGIAASSIVFAPMGVFLSHKLPVHTLKRLFGLIILLTGIHMLWG